MSYVDGYELGERLKLDGMLQEREALKIARGIAEALKYAWEEHGMLHRDIKPSNIMIDAKGVPKLMDMGISSIIGESSNKEKSVVGTPYYISPEQARNDDDIDFRSDIYSLGATLYQMVCGKVPFEAESTKKILLKQIAEPLTPPKKINEKLSSNCSKLIRIMMSKDPSDRQSSWQYLIHDIDMVLNGQSPAERLETKSYETTRVTGVSSEDLKDIGSNIHLVSKRMNRKENKVQEESTGFVPEPGQPETEPQPAKTEPAPPKIKKTPPTKVVNKRGKWRNIIFIILAVLVIGGIVWGGWTLTTKIINKVNSHRAKTVETAP
jgi:serine/threonine protein kinase